jgi:hypothetical protein
VIIFMRCIKCRHRGMRFNRCHEFDMVSQG